MDINKNYYTILNVNNDDTNNIIKKSYYELSKIHHPDKGGDALLFELINEAYKILCDKDKRTEYDKKSQYGQDYKEENEFADYQFANLKNAFDEDKYKNAKKNRLDIVEYVEDDFDGILSYERYTKCNDCDGTGKTDNKYLKVNRINPKTGKVETQYIELDDECSYCDGEGADLKGKTCPECKGAGKHDIKVSNCEKCNGDKKILTKNTLSNIYLPEDTDKVKVDFMGNYLNGKYGHLWVVNKNKIKKQDD